MPEYTFVWKQPVYYIPVDIRFRCAADGNRLLNLLQRRYNAGGSCWRHIIIVAIALLLLGLLVVVTCYLSRHKVILSGVLIGMACLFNCNVRCSWHASYSHQKLRAVMYNYSVSGLCHWVQYALQ